jgi:two-component system NtrC family sensor kinase
MMKRAFELVEENYRALFNNAFDPMWVHDLDGNFIIVNKASESVTGYTVEEMLGVNVNTFLDEKSLDIAREVKRKLLENRPLEQPYEQRLTKKDGTVAIVMMATSLVTIDRKVVGFQHTARDVTKEREMQESLSKAYQELKESQEQLIQAEKLTSLGQLAASIAHEVNNPIAGILIYTQLLMKKMTSDTLTQEKALDYLSRMESELTRTGRLVRNLLDFARETRPSLTLLNLNEVIDRAFSLVAHSAEMEHVNVVEELNPTLPEVMADPDQLRQVLTNLMLNAIQAMPKGGLLTLRSSIDSDTWAKIEVQDTGVGISPENMSKLFTPFFTTKQEVKGVGLGLAVAYGIIQRHQGRIEVQSKEGEGTTFSVYLPLQNSKK